MNLRTLGAAIALSTAVSCGTVSAAPIINLGGFTGPIQIKFQDYESFIGPPLTVGSVNFGIVKVTSIVDPTTGSNIWVPGGTNGYLSGVFTGITISSVTPTLGGFMTTNTGGAFDFWLNKTDVLPAQGTSGYGAAGCALATLCYNGITNVGGIDALNLALVPGTTTNPTNTLNVFLANTTLPTTGSGTGFADITGGAAASEFGRGGFATLFSNADFHFLDDFCTNGASGCAGPTKSNWELFSHDPVDAVAVPEPASLGLLGAALFGVYGWARRRR